MKKASILIVDDDHAIRFAFQKTFAQNQSVLSAADGLEALEIMNKEKPDLVFLDISMPKMNGLDVLETIKSKDIGVPVIIITGEGNMKTAMQAMKLGAYDYLTKPLDIDKIRLTANRALEYISIKSKLNELEQILDGPVAPGTVIIGKNKQMQEIYKKMGVISGTPETTNVLILGETGTGKELVAKAIHENGAHAKEPFVAINCTVLPENLLESELFGHEKGAFSGAENRKLGKFELAGQGTLFLDEIGDMPVALQKKLLRVIQERTFERLGGNKILHISSRIIAATHQNLNDSIKKGSFREDLYYRLNVVEINLPPLRERKDDITLLIEYFLRKYNKRFKKSVTGIAADILEKLLQFNYPGNVRELENMIESAIALEPGEILSIESFPPYLVEQVNDKSIDVKIVSNNFTLAKKALVDAFEKKFISNSLQQTSGNVSEAARHSGIERQSFQRLMKKHNIASEDFRKN
jgi:DNA-binding NtrC family response regulator